MAQKAVVILSGGADSATLLHKTAQEGFETYALTFLYGQKHEREITSARRICSPLRVSHKVIDLGALGEILQGSALTDASVEIPNVPETSEHYETLKATIVPNRNAIFLSVAVGYAVSISAGFVFFGAHHSDRGVYPDCREEFIRAFEQASRLATDRADLIISAPFVSMNKSDIVKLGAALGVPFGDTWSCYKGGAAHCGVCSSCRERKRAFREAKISDPTEYEK